MAKRIEFIKIISLWLLAMIQLDLGDAIVETSFFATVDLYMYLRVQKLGGLIVEGAGCVWGVVV